MTDAELPDLSRRDDTMAMPLTRKYTADDLQSFPDDGNRYEIIRGELLVTPSPRLTHQLISMRLTHLLSSYLYGHGVEALLAAPADVTFAADTVVEPDLFVADLTDARRSADLRDIRNLHLAVEILSLSSARTDRGLKRRLYQDQCIPTYWVVDAEQRQVEVWTPDATMPVVHRDELRWRHPNLDSDCVIDLPRLFASG
jgi:Uma2 family endonuclease